jgi:hypothetical protein
MWVKLGNEHLNLAHVVRVLFNKGWKNGHDELVAEVEGLVKGDLQVFTRYRGYDAEVLQAALLNHTVPGEEMPPAIVGRAQTMQAVSSPAIAGVASPATTNTIHDM